jgi:hypothetical protein
LWWESSRKRSLGELRLVDMFKVNVTDALGPGEVLMFSSVRLCKGEGVVCPDCMGADIAGERCQTCGGKGTVGVPSNQPGVVMLKCCG